MVRREFKAFPESAVFLVNLVYRVHPAFLAIRELLVGLGHLEFSVAKSMEKR